MFLKILAAIALGALLLLATFGVLSWDKVLWLIGVLASYLIGEKIGSKNNSSKNS